MYRLTLIGSFIVLISISMPLTAEEANKSAEVFTLGEITVSAKKEVPISATTITEVTEEDINAQGAQTVAEALEFIPGVDVRTGGKGQAFVNIRGFEQEDVKILIDGVPAHESYFGTLDLSLIPVDSISKISVTKGASSVLYGANTMGGVINIITKKGGKKPVTELTTSFGDYDTRNYIVNHGAERGNFNYWLTYSYRESDGFRLSSDFDKNNRHTGIETGYNEDGGKRDLSDYIKRNINAKIGYEPEEHTKIYLAFNYHNNERGCPSEYDRYWEFSEWNQWHINLVGEKRINEMLTVKARIFYVDHDDTLTDVSWDTVHTTGRKWFEKNAYDDYSTGGELHTSFDFGRYSFIRAGFSYIRDNHKQREFLDDDCKPVQRGWADPGWQEQEKYEADTYTFALEDEIMATDRLSFVLGVSYDYFDPKKAYNQPLPDSIDTVNPQAGVVFHFTDDTSLHASVGKKTRFPQLKELYSENAGGNPNLDPQKTISCEIGGSHIFNESIRCSMAYFYNDIDDMIESVERDNERVYVNIGETRIEGIEVAVNMRITNSLQAGINYTYLSTIDKESNREMEERPRHRLNTDIRYRFPFGLTAYLQTSYTQRQFEYDRDGEKRKYPDFFLVNLGIDQNLGSFMGINSKLFARVKNITDKDYDEGHPMPGMNFLAGLTMRY